MTHELSPLVVAPSATEATPELPFSSPDAVDPRLEELLAGASAQLTRWLASASSRSPLPSLAAQPEVPPQSCGLDASRLLADLQLVMDGAFNANHPGALAHLDPPPLAASIAADLICAGLNNNLLAEELSPSLTRLERSLCAWLAEAVGLPPGAGGVPASGGTLSNLMALVTARVSRGLQQCSDAVVLASEDCHVSIGKALMVMGLPQQTLQCLPVDSEGRLDPAALADRLQHLSQRGTPLLAVVATAGTTVRGAVDPLPEVAALCRQYGVWLHIDGAIGAVFALSGKHACRVDGLGLADSLTVNPQKLLGITKTSSLLLLAQPQALSAAFATGLPYMESSWGGPHGGECGLQGTRPAEVLKLWLGLRQLGLSGIAATIDGAIARRRQLQSLLASVPGLDLRHGCLHLLAMTPGGLDADAAERWSLATRQRLLAAHLMLSRPLYQGRHHLKAVLGNPHTGDREMHRLAAMIRASVEELA